MLRLHTPSQARLAAAPGVNDTAKHLNLGVGDKVTQQI